MTPDVLKDIKMKRRAWNRYLSTKKNIDVLEYKKVRNEVNDRVKQAKLDNEKSIALNAKKEPKRFWKYVKQKTKSKSSTGNLQKNGGTMTQTDNEKATELKFFASVFTRENVSNIPTVQDLNFDRPLETVDIIATEVEKLLHELRQRNLWGQTICIHFCSKNCQKHYVILWVSYFKSRFQQGQSQKSGIMQR